jgi:two-component system chemotaxis response regulator CheB
VALADPTGTDTLRVVVIDDSAFMRSVIKHIVLGEAGFSVVGEGADGRAGLSVIERERPDIVTLDVEMPNLDGIGVLREMKATPTGRPLVVMVSAHTAEGARVTMDALRSGAFDFVPKASEQAKMDLAQISAMLRTKLAQCRTALRRMPQRSPEAARAGPSPTAPSQRPTSLAALAFANALASGNPPQPQPQPSPARPGPAIGTDRPDLVVVGISTGGPHTLPTFLGGLRGFEPPVIVAQHIPEVFSKSLAAMLAEMTGQRVVEGVAGDVVEPSTVYILRGGTDTEVHRRSDGRFALRAASGDGHAYHPSANALFRSAALAARRPVGVIMTGMGDDGTEGARLLVARGRPVIVQDPATCVIPGMPQSALAAGLKLEALAPAEIATRLRAMAPAG